MHSHSYVFKVLKLLLPPPPAATQMQFKSKLKMLKTENLFSS